MSTKDGYLSVFYKKENNNYLYVFQYKDHLGNNRLTYADLDGDGEVTPGEIIEENNYYPFGLRHKGYNELATENPSGFKYKFGGKELNDELGFEVYDFGARNYDPALGRWMNIDPLAEEMRRFSPYNYAFNNPVYFIDPDGMAPFGFDKNKLEELKPIVDINEMLAYEPEPVGMVEDGIETDYTLNKKTGEVKQHGEKNDQPDRIIEVKKNGKVKVKIDNIAKGILEDGMNLKTNNNIIKVNGKGLPTTSDVEDFAVELSSYVGKEIGGTYLSKNSNLVTDIAIGRYEKNRYGLTKSYGIITALREGFTKDDFRGFFHTHPKGSRQASPQDIASRDKSLGTNRNLYFHILTKARYGELGRSHIFNYTNKTK